MIADIFTKALPKPAHDKHASTMLSDLPQAIIDMTLSSDSLVAPEDRAVEKEDCKPTFEEVPEFEGSPSPKDSYMVVRSVFWNIRAWLGLDWVVNSMI